MSERSDVQDPIRVALGQEPDLKLWRMGVAKHPEWNPSTGGERWVTAGTKGCPDLLGVLRVEWVRLTSAPGLYQLARPIGMLFGLETKAGRRGLSEAQQRWHDAAHAHGAFVAVVRNEAEARAALERARRGETS